MYYHSNFINKWYYIFRKLKQGSKQTTAWNKCRSSKKTQVINKNLDYMVRPSFRNLNKLFAFSFKTSNNGNANGSFANSIPLQINFTGRLKEDDGVTMCFILDFSLDLPN